MPAVDTDLTGVVVAARGGDRQAREELAARALPLVYTVVARALHGDPDLDDVVQDTMLRAVRDLPMLRDPGQFRAWLMAIAVRQVGTHLHRRRTYGARVAPLDEALDVPREDPTLLHAALSEQRRQVARAGRWLDPADRMLLSLWWLEQIGQLTREELAEATGVRGAHVRVRLQRMRDQLELSRSVVAALDAVPPCPRLSAGWDGTPSPLWRKRLARHVRTCAACARASAGLVPTERLLDHALLPVPAGLAAAVLSDGGVPGGVVKSSLLAKAMAALAHHPLALTAAGGLLVAVVAATVPWSPAAPPPPAPAPPPATAAAAALPLGPISLEAADSPGRYAATARNLGVLVRVDAAGPTALRRQATFEVTSGIADARCFTLRTAAGWYLRHSSWRLRSAPEERSPLFRGDATFCARAGSLPGSVSLESSNYPGWFLRHRDGELWVDRADGSAGFQADTAFVVRAPLAG
ncbi:sigma-70 family RNA polymerase sigma factor [Asanoa siamensis]|uniref:RNA polymerase sigma factor (Sigma-70 family) n=1 Tax=Asanoa siamensis TaxID=926357 RepID=A0ABQ4CT85_9ACTN|nr:sigma-70 family RNA polymerase sigma factor [Asanoa siamensis]GIF74492.1 hypothetical protein Asi02nite_40100 [Asanoa siamensis]